MDRLAHFIPCCRFIRKFNPFLLWLLVSLVCSLINIPTLLLEYAPSDQEFYRNIAASFQNGTKFRQCGSGILRNDIISLSLVIFFRDILTLIIEITTSWLVVHYFLKFLSKKAILKSAPTPTALAATVEYQKKLSWMKRENSTLTLMSIVLATVSTLLHSIILIGYMMQARNGILGLTNQWANYFFMIGILIGVAKNASNFGIFYSTNKNFNKCFRGLVSRRRRNNSGSVGENDGLQENLNKEHLNLSLRWAWKLNI